MVYRFIFFTFFLVGFSTTAQITQVVSGVVKSKLDGMPLPSATILEVTSKKGAVSNFDGEFSLIVIKRKNEKYQLKVSFIGFKTKIIPITDKNYYEIVLEEMDNVLNEIVVTSSYGTKKLKQDIVGSIENIKPEEVVTEQAATSFDQLLEGQIAGVYIETNNELGGEVKINIRGQGSLTPLNNNVVGTSTQPLIIVDGIIMSEETGIDGNNFFDAGGDGRFSENILNPLSRLGIQDIESFNILKDAAAVGLYGADAANGVIIITTKSGKKGKTNFNASVQSGISTAINEFQYLSGEQYQQVINTFHFNNGDFNNIKEWNGVNTNWHDLLNTNGSYTNYNLSASGGFKNWSYRASLGYQINNESQINNDLKRLNSSFNIGYKKEKLGISLRVSPSIAEKNNPNTLYAFALDPTIPVFDENGEYTRFDFYGNPLAVANQNKRQSKTLAILTSASLNYQILDNLKFSTLFGMDFSEKNEERFFSGENGSGISPNGDLGERTLRERNTNKWNWNASLFYNTIFNQKHSFDALIGIETRKDKTSFSFARGDNFIVFDTPQPIVLAENQDYETDSDINTGRSIFSQINYDFEKKYYLLFNFRVDQSSAFGNDKNTALNGGIGGAWLISNESFFTTNAINSLKLRTSFGSTGNSRIGSYRALGLFTVDNEGGDGYNGYNYANSDDPPNPNLGWERNIKFNVGLDVNFLNKYSATLEFFRDNRKDIITSRNTIPETGYPDVQINGSEMYNQGIEFSIAANWFSTEDFKWTSNFNYSRIRNKVTFLSGLGSEFSSAETARAQRVGFPTSTIWGYQSIGIDPATGRDLFNVNGIVYDESVVADLADENWIPIGDSNPAFFGGFRNSVTYKNLKFNIVISYAYDQDIIVDRTLFDNYNVLFNRNLNVNIFEDAWQNQGDVAQYPIITSNRRLVNNSSRYVFDASHIKLKAVNLSYQLPIKNKKIKNCSIFLNGTNLKYWFKNKSPKGKNGVAEFRNTYPEMQTYSLGINTSF